MNLINEFMNLKKATLLAIIGIALMVIVNMYNLFISIKYIDVLYIVQRIAILLGVLSVMPFLVILYKNQK